MHHGGALRIESGECLYAPPNLIRWQRNVLPVHTFVQDVFNRFVIFDIIICHGFAHAWNSKSLPENGFLDRIMTSPTELTDAPMYINFPKLF
jgi:hypothetical protein